MLQQLPLMPAPAWSQLALSAVYMGVTSDTLPAHAAPEVISNAQRRYCGQKADTWSCGVLLYVLLFHRYPFERSGDPTGAEGLAKVSIWQV